ncbi:hypothetical protein NOS3756_60010 (plasmid) [Nostoc sp. NIES-3756]|nr:hypothetical protein NOS3756_60010 [Nostoc sp. NIES-3756]
MTRNSDSLFTFESTADFTNFNSKHLLKVCIEDSQLKNFLPYFFTLILEKKFNKKLINLTDPIL